MLFLQPGKHAGAGGDVDQLVEEAQRRWAEAAGEGRAARRVLKTGLLAPHPLLIGLLVRAQWHIRRAVLTCLGWAQADRIGQALPVTRGDDAASAPTAPK